MNHYNALVLRLQQKFLYRIAVVTTYLVVLSNINHHDHHDRTSTTMIFGVSAVSLPSSSFLQQQQQQQQQNSGNDKISTNTDRKIFQQQQPLLLDMNASYTFEQFLSDFGRSYSSDPIEYKVRENIFYKNLRTIVQHNNNRQRIILLKQNERSDSTKSIGNYWMGMNEFADRESHELPRGYDKYQSTIVLTSTTQRRRHRRHLIQSSETEKKIYDRKILEEKLGISIEPISTLPNQIDWRTYGVTTPVKSQGQCGSCWAFASTAVMESHIAIQTGYIYELSPQELVSCTYNPKHCGGTGGCSGATAEIAFNLIQQYGIVQEWQFGYQDSTGQIINCSLSTNEVNYNNTNRTYFHGAVASITDYMVLPSNDYVALMNVVAKHGPVAVSVACMPWHLYQSGIFYVPFNSSSTSTTDLDHLVVLEGYGTDIDTGEDYWLVRNSWSPRWGEHGYIRLKRHNEDDQEEKECVYDTTPADGTACTFDPETGNPIVPLPQKICGNSGILFDSAVPIGGYLL